jgi:hypothetical protein
MVKPVEAALHLVYFYSVIFFRPLGHYVRNISLFNQNISSVYHIVAMRVIKHPGHTYRGFGSVFYDRGMTSGIRARLTLGR